MDLGGQQLEAWEVHRVRRREIRHQASKDLAKLRAQFPVQTANFQADWVALEELLERAEEAAESQLARGGAGRQLPELE